MVVGLKQCSFNLVHLVHWAVKQVLLLIMDQSADGRLHHRSPPHTFFNRVEVVGMCHQTPVLRLFLGDGRWRQAKYLSLFLFSITGSSLR